MPNLRVKPAAVSSCGITAAPWHRGTVAPRLSLIALNETAAL